MCGSYGLRIGEPAGDDPHGLLGVPALDARISGDLLDEWARAHDGTARITGRHARNLNPLVVADGARLAWWWLHLDGAPAPYSAFNARAENLVKSWRPGLARRGLAPATWYVEKGRSFGLAGRPFALATITTATSHEGGGELLSYALVTRAAVGVAADTHPRMPLLLPDEMHERWLDPAVAGDAALVADAVAASAEISREVGLVDGRGPEPATLF